MSLPRRNMVMTEAQLRGVIRETLIQEGVLSKIGDWLKNKMGVEKSNKVRDFEDNQWKDLRSGFKKIYKVNLEMAKRVEKDEEFESWKQWLGEGGPGECSKANPCIFLQTGTPKDAKDYARKLTQYSIEFELRQYIQEM